MPASFARSIPPMFGSTIAGCTIRFRFSEPGLEHRGRRGEIGEERLESCKRFPRARCGHRRDLDALAQPPWRHHRAVDPRGVRRRGRFGHEHVFAACLAQERCKARGRPVAVALNVNDGAARELGNQRAELRFELMDVDFDQHRLGVLQRLCGGVADFGELRKTGFLRDEVLRLAFDAEAARLAHCRELIFLLRKDRVAHFMARQREICRAHGADRARGITDHCDFRHAVAPLDKPSLRPRPFIQGFFR